MTARDVRYGRQGGRVTAWVPVEGETVRVRCACPDVAFWTVIPGDVGKPCWTCNEPLVPAEVVAA